MSLGNGQDEIGAWMPGPRSGRVPPESGGQEAEMGMDSLPILQMTGEWRRDQGSLSTSFASIAKVPPRTGVIRWLSLLHEVPLSRSDVGQVRGTRSGEAITLGAERSPYQGRITGPVKFINQLLAAWKLTADSACILLGFEPSDSTYVHDVLRGYATLRGRDAKDRIAHLFQIRTSLSALFQDEVVENEWLRESQRALNGKTPMELLREGSMENLLLVKEYVEFVAGR